MIRIKRVYEKPEPSDGLRILVDRLWPRGLRKDAARLDGWIKDVAPSTTLRRWFGHDPRRWADFQKRFYSELNKNPGSWRSLLEQSRTRRVTLLYSAHDSDHNNAVALKRFLDRRTKRRGPGTKAAVRRSA